MLNIFFQMSLAKPFHSVLLLKLLMPLSNNGLSFTKSASPCHATTHFVQYAKRSSSS